jgi:site-specific DNA-methyltransferase (adenine-specific)
MIELPNESVHHVITSPPYWQLKDYGTDNQIGFDDSYDILTPRKVWTEGSVVWEGEGFLFGGRP